MPPAHAGRRRRGGDAAVPVRPAGGTLDARRPPRSLATQPAGDGERRRRVHRPARPVDRGPRGAAPLRPGVPRTHRRRGRRAVVHDAVRPRQPAHVVDVDDRRLGPGARHVADPGALPGHRGEPADRGGARPHPPRDALRGVRRALPRRRTDLLRQRRRHPVVRDAPRRAAAVGEPPGGGRRAHARGRPCARLDRRVRRPRRRRLRRVPADQRPGAREPGLEGLARLDPLRRRPPRRRSRRPVRGAGLRVRRARRAVALRHRGGRRAVRGASCVRARPSSRRGSIATSGSRSRAGWRWASTGTSGRSTR